MYQEEGPTTEISISEGRLVQQSNVCKCQVSPCRGCSLGFYQEKRIAQFLENDMMPVTGSSGDAAMDQLAAAGFDYRAALVKFAKSLGNER